MNENKVKWINIKVATVSKYHNNSSYGNDDIKMVN